MTTDRHHDEEPTPSKARPSGAYRVCPHCEAEGVRAVGRVTEASGRIRRLICDRCGRSFKRVFRFVKWYQYCPLCKEKGRVGIGLVERTDGRRRFLRCTRCDQRFIRVWSEAEPPEDKRQD